MSWQATNWEFKNRALVFGLVFALDFGAYAVDSQNSAAAFSNWLGASRGLDANVIGRVLFALADGPYRHVRNPPYFANMLLVIGLAALMSRIGVLIAIPAMLVFCYRLILREESELESSQGEPYRRYRSAVPRLWPSLRPRVSSAGRRSSWLEGFWAEYWSWGFAIATSVFAATLNTQLFFIILTTSIVVLWLMSKTLANKARSTRPAEP